MGRRSSLLALILLVGSPVAGEEEPAPPAARGPVVVELFTSQGCSSCPPADRLLSRLAAGEARIDGVEVVPLAFHVDYWNYIGWTDPFSDAAWSERQRRYARALPGGRVYTPQLVVDGAAHVVGSDERRVREEIARAAGSTAGGEVALVLDEGGDDGRLGVEISARVQEGTAGEWRAMVAVFENGLLTPVPRGENDGRSLANGRVVRRLFEAFSLPARPGAVRSERLEIELEDGWKRRNLGVAVFLQDPETLRIRGAAVQKLEG